MNASGFHSLLGQELQTYVDYKRALGRKFDTEARALDLLDRFLINRTITDLGALTPALIDAFLGSRPRPKPRSFNHLLGVIRGFFDWMVAQQRSPNSPVRTEARRCPRQPRPFLFTPEQFRQLLAFAARLPDDARARHRAAVYSLIFSLLYGLGLRVGEVTRLRYRDVDQSRRLLVIRETKFGKSRLVPFGPRMGEKITEYLHQRVDWYGCRSRILMQPSEDRHDEGRERLGIPQHRRVPLLVRDDRPAHPRSRTGVFATDGSNPDTTT